MNVRRLSPSDIPLIQTLFRDVPYESIGIRGLMTYGNLAMLPWYGVLQRDEIIGVAVLIPGQLALTWSKTPKYCELLGDAFRGKHAPCTTIGPMDCAQNLWNGWTPTAPTITPQTLYTATDISQGPIASGFRAARDDEARRIAELGGSGEEEETGTNSFHQHPKRLEAVALGRIQSGHTWVIEEKGEIVFQVHAAPVLNDACQLVGTYVPPNFRGMGWSTAGIRGFLGEMIPRTGAIVLRVTDSNTAAVRAYTRNGFQPLARFGVLNPKS